MRHNSFLAMAFAAAAMATGPEFRAQRAQRSAINRLTQRFGGVTYQANGGRECERRRRQIASGQLTEANGLLRGAQ